MKRTHIKTLITKRNILLNILKNKFYCSIFFLGFVILISVPILVSNIIIPAFENQILSNIVDESKRVAKHLSASINYENINANEIDILINQELNEFQIKKIHYFNKVGKVIYSTQKENIGTLNTKAYFRDIVSKGEIFYKIDHKGNNTAEGDKVVIDMIEIYIPIIKNGEFSGAFELYYDITEETTEFLLLREQVTLSNILISLLLGTIMFMMLYNASKNNLKEEKVLSDNLLIQEKLKIKTTELLNLNETLNNSIIHLAKTQEQLIESQQITNIARKNAEEANREKSMFLANVSHELKTPLNGIFGLIYLTKLKVTDNEVKRNLSNIQDYSETLLRMISDLLDSSKIDAKKIKVEMSSFNLKEMIESINQIYSIQSKEKNIEFVLKYDKNIPNTIISDPVRLYQVITNLINNAVKFTHLGKVRLDVSIQSLSEENVKIEFMVKDDGIGIKKEELKNIFKPFYQTKESLTYYAGGSGLGLNICHKIVEELDGLIWADSEVERGSSFFVLMDFKIVKENLKEEENLYKQLINISNKKVLVVDDNHINREVLDGILKSIGINCDTASNGMEAFELVKKRKYDLVLTDIKMPVMNGCQLCREIRKIYDLNELPIITISANTKEETDSCLKSCGANINIQKPINPENFLKELSKFINYSNNTEEKRTNIESAENSTLEIKSALFRFVNNESLYKNTLQNFINDNSNSHNEIKSFIKEQKIKEVLDYLDTIKGVSANLSAIKLSYITTKLHDAIKYGKKYESFISQYEEEWDKLKNEIAIYLAENIKERKTNIIDKVENKEEILLTLLKYCDEYNSKGAHLYRSLSSSLKEDPFLSKLEHDILNYNFKKVRNEIEKYFIERNKECKEVTKIQTL